MPGRTRVVAASARPRRGPAPRGRRATTRGGIGAGVTLSSAAVERSPSTQTPGGVDEPPRLAGGGQRRQHRVEEGLLELRPARAVGERRVHDRVVADGRGEIAGGHAEIAEHAAGAARVEALGLLRIADQRGDVMAGLDEGVEDGGADVAGATCEEYAHEIRPRGGRNSTWPRRTGATRRSLAPSRMGPDPVTATDPRRGRRHRTR